MGNVICKPCCVGEKPKKEGNEHRIMQPVEDGNEAKLLTNHGNTIDKTSDTSKSPVPSEKKNGKPVDIDNITIDEKATPKQDQQDKTIKDEPGPTKNGRSKKKNKRYVESSSDTTSSSSSSDADSHVEKKYKKKNKDGSITKVYSKTTYSAGTKINIIKGDHITINDNKTIIQKKPPKKKPDPRRLFTEMFTEQSAREFQTNIFRQPGPFNLDGGGAFIDLTECKLVEFVDERELLNKWTKSVGILRSTNGTCTCFRVGSKYIMTALHGIRAIMEPEYEGFQNTTETDWLANLDALRSPTVFVDFHYTTDGEHYEHNKFFFNVVGNTVPFFDESTDCIVLELKCEPGRQLPPPFKQFGVPKLDKTFSLVHHASGRPKQVESVHKIIDMNAARTRADIQSLNGLSEEFLLRKGKDTDRYRCEHIPYVLLGNRNRLLFHCISNKGASGCPGIQLLSDRTVVVVTMLLCGYPDWYYSTGCADITSEWNKSNTVEQGVNFASVYSEMRQKDNRLFRDIFEVTPSRTVQPVPPES